MKQIMYSIFDRPTQEHALPFVAGTDEAAFRMVRGSLAPQSQLVLYPSDYAIVQVGFFDSETGIVEPVYKVVEEIKSLIPTGLREYALDGTFFGGVSDEKTKDTPAQS